jgi:tetratricopeptide (TPR) repeat protein
MGGCFADLGQNYLAIDACNKALALDPNNGTAYGNRSFAYSNLGQYDQAIQDADKTIAFGSTAWAHNNRGVIYLRLKQYDRAIIDFDKALELDPKYERAENNRKACLEAMDKENRNK